jgi:hypothetical protein
MKVIVQVEPKDVYERFPPKLKEVTDSLVKSIMESEVFDTEEQARDWATVQVWKSLQNIAKESKEHS